MKLDDEVSLNLGFRFCVGWREKNAWEKVACVETRIAIRVSRRVLCLCEKLSCRPPTQHSRWECKQWSRLVLCFRLAPRRRVQLSGFEMALSQMIDGQLCRGLHVHLENLSNTGRGERANAKLEPFMCV